MDCRTHQRRKEIIKKFEVIPQGHVKLSPGKIVLGDAGSKIKDEYFTFRCVERNTQQEETILVGSHVARDFFDLTNTKAPNLVNIFQEQGNSNRVCHTNHNNSNKVEKWNPAAKQLYNGIKIIITAWKMKQGVIFDFLHSVEKYKRYEPFLSKVERLNDMLKRNNTSMRSIIKEEEKNSLIPLKKFSFDLLEEILHKHNKLSYFEDKNGR